MKELIFVPEKTRDSYYVRTFIIEKIAELNKETNEKWKLIHCINGY